MNASVLQPGLGFGTSSLVGDLGSRDGIDFLEKVLESGVRHIDTARLYGSGDAEKIVGEALLRFGSPVRVVTKAGLSQPGAVSRMSYAKRLARPILRALPHLRRFLLRSMAATSSFDPSTLRRSIAESMEALKTPSVAALLLHDCPADVWRTREVRGVLEESRGRGEAVAVGIATSVDATHDVLSNPAGSPPQVVQFVDDFTARTGGLMTKAEQKGMFLITHSAISVAQSWDEKVRKLSGSQRSRWDDLMAVTPSTRRELAETAIRVAAARNRKGVVLFRSKRADRVKIAREASESPADSDLVSRWVEAAELLAAAEFRGSALRR